MSENGDSEPDVKSASCDHSGKGAIEERSTHRARRSCLGVGLAAFGAFLALGPLSYVALGYVSVWDGLLGLLTSVTFLVLAFLAADACFMKRDRVLFCLFIAVFFWPLVSAGISLLVLGQISSGNIPWRFRMGGEGDPVSVQGQLEMLVAGGGEFVRWSMALMLLTNISFLIPVSMIHRRVSRSLDVVSTPSKGPSDD